MLIERDVLALVLALLNLGGLVYTLGWRIGRLQLKVDTLWDFMIQNARTDARARKVIQEESPVRLNGWVKEQFVRVELDRPLLTFYRLFGMQTCTDSEVVWLFYQKFRDPLIEKICLPLSVNLGSALIAAVQLCREGDISAGAENRNS